MSINYRKELIDLINSITDNHLIANIYFMVVKLNQRYGHDYRPSRERNESHA